jgi:hypothetical protein
MSNPQFLRRQAEACVRLAQTCSDRTTAEYLTLLGAEFFRRATEAENDWLVTPPLTSSEGDTQRR